MKHKLNVIFAIAIFLFLFIGLPSLFAGKSFSQIFSGQIESLFKIVSCIIGMVVVYFIGSYLFGEK